MKIVVLDGYTLNPGDLDWEEMKKLGDLTVYDRTSFNLEDNREELVERSKDADVLLVNKTPLDRRVLKELPKLKYIGVLGTGYNAVDTEYAKKKGIVVTNVPSYGTDSVAQMTMALLLEITNRVGHHNDQVKTGRWSRSDDWCFWDYPLIEISNKTMGIIGYGRIGKKTAQIAKAFGMNIIASTRGEEYEEDGISFLKLPKLLKKADVVSLHAPLTDDTQNMINKDTIKMMKDGVIILNTARGGLIVEEDLVEGLKTGKVYGAGLDVISEEPMSEDNPLLKLDNCIMTPHIAWAPKEARIRLMKTAVNNLKSFINGSPINQVGL